MTERDARSFGFELVDCPASIAGRIYVEPDSSFSVDEYCRTVVQARRAALEDGIASALTLSADSIEVITVSVGRYAQVSYPAPDFFVDVAFDLRSRNRNLRVVLNRPTGEPEISWAPEGLRY